MLEPSVVPVWRYFCNFVNLLKADEYCKKCIIFFVCIFVSLINVFLIVLHDFISVWSLNATKIILYETLIRPLVSYGTEAWTLTKKEEQVLLIFERKIFRRIYGPNYENGEWKRRTNRGLEEMRKGEYIVKSIKVQRISWLGHLERMEEDRMPKKIFTQELEGTRRRGRPT